MPWPSKHGIAASSRASYTPPDRDEVPSESVPQYLGVGYQFNTPSSQGGLSPFWAFTGSTVPSDLLPAAGFERSLVGGFYNKDGLVIGNSALGLRAMWPSHTYLNPDRGFALNRIEVKSRPIGSTGWRSVRSVKIRDTSNPRSLGEALSFVANPADEYQADAYWGYYPDRPFSGSVVAGSEGRLATGVFGYEGVGITLGVAALPLALRVSELLLGIETKLSPVAERVDTVAGTGFIREMLVDDIGFVQYVQKVPRTPEQRVPTLLGVDYLFNTLSSTYAYNL